jgi:hypothetical protein
MTDKPNRYVTPAPSDLEKLGDTTLKGALSLFGGGSYLYDLIKLRKDTMREAVRKKDEETLDAFFADLLDGNTAIDPAQADALIDDRDFHSLLRACVADIEAEKGEAYSALAKSIAVGSVHIEWKRHFILSLKEISLKELESLRRAFVAKQFKLVPQNSMGSSTVKESEFLKIGEPGSFQSIAIQNLTNRGFVHDGKLSNTGETFICACTSPARLTPTAIGYKVWSGQNVAIISYELDDNRIAKLTVDVGNALWSYQIKSSTVAITKSSQQHLRMFSTQGVLLLGSENRGLVEHAQALCDFASKVPLVVVQLSDQCPPIPPGIKVSKVVRYETDIRETIKNLTSSVLDFRNTKKDL